MIQSAPQPKRCGAKERQIDERPQRTQLQQRAGHLDEVGQNDTGGQLTFVLA